MSEVERNAIGSKQPRNDQLHVHVSVLPNEQMDNLQRVREFACRNAISLLHKKETFQIVGTTVS